MAIKVSGVNVIDDDRNLNVGVLTATSIDAPIEPLRFWPVDGSDDWNTSATYAFVYYGVGVAKSTGTINFRQGSISGTVLEAIDITDSKVSISGGQVYMNPSLANFPSGKEIFVEIPAGAFTSTELNNTSSSTAINTYSFTTGEVPYNTFSPANASTRQDIDINIVVEFKENITKGTGNIYLRSGSASGTILQTIDVTSGAVSVSGDTMTINPPSNLPNDTEIYVGSDDGVILNADGDSASAWQFPSWYHFRTAIAWPNLGAAGCGGYLICKSSRIYWITSTCEMGVYRSWYQRCDAATCAQQVSGCSGWFIPSIQQWQNPGQQCRQYFDWYTAPLWSNSPGDHPYHAWMMYLGNGSCSQGGKQNSNIYARAFRCVSY